MATTNIDDFLELDYGINDIDYAVPTVNLEGQNILLNDDEMINPFFVELNKRELDALEPKELHKLYKHIYVMCARNDFVNSDSASLVFNKTIKKSDYQQFNNCFTLIKCSKNMLYNKIHYDQAKIITVEQLSIFKNFNFDNTEIIVPLYEMREQAVLLYNSLYDSQFKLNQLEDIFGLIKFYSISSNGIAMKNLSNMIYEMKESEFWRNSHNCSMNMSELFSQRSFQYKEINNGNSKSIISSNNLLNKEDVVQNIINKLSDSKNSYDLNNNKKDTFTDIAGALQSSIKRTYYATDPLLLEFNKDKITEIFSQLNSEKELYDVFNSLLVSKDYCHTVLNNSYVLDKMNPIINKYLPMYKYLFGYAWLSLYTEECIFKTKTTKNNRYVFDINTASKLPVFPFCVEDLHQNPYISVLVSENLLNSKNNCLSLPMIENYDGYGITDLTEFRKRFNIYTCGDPNKNLLDGIDWTRFAVSGSSLTACLMKRSPLFDLVTNQNQSETEKWLTYFNNYYSDSDIDLMCNESSVFKFMDQVRNVVNCVKNNLKTNVFVEPFKTMAVVVTGHYITQRLEHIREHTGMNWTAEDVVKNISSNVMKEYFYEIYCNAKFKSNRNFRQIYGSESNLLYNEFYKMSSIDDMNISLVTYEMDKNMKHEIDSEVCFYLNDYRTNETLLPDDKNFLALKVSENIKFKIRGEGMLHNIETFRVKNDDFFAVVAKFHLGNVRTYYTGDNVYLLPSCITALMTGVNIDYKYFAGARDPIDILQKYRERSYGVLLNKKEKEHMLYYINNVPKLNEKFKLPANKEAAMNILFGAKDINHSMFKPLLFKGHAADIYPHKDYKYIHTIDDLTKYYKSKYNYDASNCAINMLRLKTINSDGNITPLKSWVPKAYYEMFN